MPAARSLKVGHIHRLARFCPSPSSCTLVRLAKEGQALHKTAKAEIDKSTAPMPLRRVRFTKHDHREQNGRLDRLRKTRVSDPEPIFRI